jgi:hypothetical protein
LTSIKARQTDTERAHRIVQRQIPRRVLEPALVYQPRRREPHHSELETRLQQLQTAQLAGKSHAGCIRTISGGEKSYRTKCGAPI